MSKIKTTAPMDQVSKFTGGILKMQKANAADAAKDLTNAFDLYLAASELLNDVCKNKAHVHRKEAMDAMRTCLKRAEEIREVLEGGKRASSSSTAAAATRHTGTAVAPTQISQNGQVSWDDIIGADRARQVLTEAINLPRIAPQQFKGIRKPWRGMLLFGPPGTGKTLIAKAAACSTGASFFELSASEIISKYVGDSEHNIVDVFTSARNAKPALVFIDEIDSLCKKRDGSGDSSESAARIKTTFLTQMDGVNVDNDGLVIMAATNLPWELDEAIVRRFEIRLLIDMPNLEAREKILRRMLHETPHALDDATFQLLAERTEGRSGADLAVLMKQAAMRSLDQLIPMMQDGTDPANLPLMPIRVEDVEAALKQTSCSVEDGSIKKNHDWAQKHGERAT